MMLKFRSKWIISRLGSFEINSAISLSPSFSVSASKMSCQGGRRWSQGDAGVDVVDLSHNGDASD
jgi:hypothetical protein